MVNVVACGSLGGAFASLLQLDAFTDRWLPLRGGLIPWALAALGVAAAVSLGRWWSRLYGVDRLVGEARDLQRLTRGVRDFRAASSEVRGAAVVGGAAGGALERSPLARAVYFWVVPAALLGLGLPALFLKLNTPLEAQAVPVTCKVERFEESSSGKTAVVRARCLLESGAGGVLSERVKRSAGWSSGRPPTHLELRAAPGRFFGLYARVESFQFRTRGDDWPSD